MSTRQTSVHDGSSTRGTKESAGKQDGAQSLEQLNQNVKDATSTITSTVKDTANQVADAAKSTVQQMAASAQANATEMVEEAKDTAQSKVSEQRVQLADQLGSLAKALRETGDKLQTEDNAPAAQYAKVAADQVQRISGYLQESDMTVIVRDLSDFARRQPGLFLASSVTAGFFLGRFLKSTSQRSPDLHARGSENRVYDQPGYLSSDFRAPQGQWSQGQFRGETQQGPLAQPANIQQGGSRVGESYSYGTTSSQEPASVPQPSTYAQSEQTWDDTKAAPHGSGPSEEFAGE